jgi:hypothetical protein
MPAVRVTADALVDFSLRMAQALLVQELFSSAIDPLLRDALAAMYVEKETPMHRVVFALAKFVVMVCAIRAVFG